MKINTRYACHNMCLYVKQAMHATYMLFGITMVTAVSNSYLKALCSTTKYLGTPIAYRTVIHALML